MFISLEMIIMFLGIISVPIIFILNRPKEKEKIKIVENDIVLFDEDLKELIQETFKDSIQHDYSEIQLINDTIIQEIKDNINDRIQHDYSEIELISQDTIDNITNEINNSISKNISDISNIDYTPLNELSTDLKETVESTLKETINAYKDTFIKDQKKANVSLNTKTIYEVIPDRYIDLIEKDIDHCVYANETVRYIGSNLKITIFTQNPNEFWYIEVQKDVKEKYGLSLSQKKRIINITAYIKYTLGLELNINELNSFNYIKKRIKNV